MEFMDGLENIAIMMDRGYSDESLTEVCSMAYLPTRRKPRFPINSARNQVDAWVTLESYETALDKLSEEAKGVKILRCETEKSCGFFFFNGRQAELHFWNMHQEHVNPNMDQVGKPREPSKPTVMKAASDKNHVEEAEDKHPDIKKSDTRVGLTVNIHSDNIEQEKVAKSKHTGTKEPYCKSDLLVNSQSIEKVEICKPNWEDTNKNNDDMYKGGNG